MKKMKLISSVTCTLMGMGTISIATATTIKSASSANSWNANTVYNSGDQVSYNGKTYTAKWWTKGDIPGNSDVWSSPKEEGAEWNSSQAYSGGDTVTYQGNQYKAKYWTRGDNPANSGQYGPWELVGSQNSKGIVAIILPSKPEFVTDSSLASIQVEKDGTVIAEVKDAKWSSTTNLNIPFSGSSTNLTINVLPLNGAKGTASPSNFTLKNEGTQKVEIEYKQTEIGSIHIKTNADVATTTGYSLKNSAGETVANGFLDTNDDTIIDNLPSSQKGITYKLYVDSFSKDGFTYTPKQIAPIIVHDFNTTDVEVNFTKETLPSEVLVVNVSGLPKDKSKTITFTNSNGQSTKTQIKSDGTISKEIEKDGSTWNIAVTSVTGYKAIISPSSFTADQDTQNINISFEQLAPIESGKKVIGYYWKPGLISNDYKGSAEDVAPYTHVIYSFLTLDGSPNPDVPANKNWSGAYLNESMAGTDVLKVMGNYENPWDNNSNWQRVRIDNLIKVTHENKGKFIWAIGGWSDLQQTLKDDQVDAFVDQVVELLKLAGDGIDFDWEHMSQLANGSPNPNKDQQLAVLAKTLKTLRDRLDAEGMQDKQIGYTTRFNAFFESSKAHGFASDYNSDSEGIAIQKWLRDHDSSLEKTVNWVNIMAYDVSPQEMPKAQTWNMPLYKDMLSSFAKYVDPSLVLLGFEPGGQGRQWYVGRHGSR
ncbi:carbohydrate-binding protein [Francisella tularensis]|uniref:carbohydrate-binding protein n=1 Tax=Francisella tularensis TaxID=263 RepID=UPI000582D93B|nr:carbohydrate-binding protein [Francisella tularensis]KHS55251.1 chitinase [Francisella tularensis subsp. holarctica]KXO24492.1 chitinase [Francisella tularensis]KXO30077.1 chitinase [Francisella tularensis]KXO35648.1 chitinase [Francisella tularensis]KXO45509.1 chitinase [Francisella tularensis]